VQHNTVCNCIYIHTNIATCSMTQSHCPIFLVFNFINLFFKILMYYSPADFSSWFWSKGKSRKIFDIIILTKSVSFKFQFWWVWRGGSWQPPPPWVRPWTLLKIPYKVFTITSHKDSEGGKDSWDSILTLTFGTTRTAESLSIRVCRTLPSRKFLDTHFS
jgi:hypothetical protein